MLKIENYRIGLIERKSKLEKTLMFYKINDDKYLDLINKKEYCYSNNKSTEKLLITEDLYDYITPSKWTATGAIEEDTLEFCDEAELIEFLKSRNFKSYSEEIEEQEKQEKTTYVH